MRQRYVRSGHIGSASGRAITTDTFRTSSFRATLHSFIDACNEVYDLTAATSVGTDVTLRILPAPDRIVFTGAVKGLFGTFTILLDRRYRAGERILAKGHDGVVEEISLRSTKIREFLTNHLIFIPNDQMADADIVNIGRRKSMSRICDLHIPVDTSREKVEKALVAIRGVLAKQEDMDPKVPSKAFFNDFNSDSFNLRIIYWHIPPDRLAGRIKSPGGGMKIRRIR